MPPLGPDEGPSASLNMPQLVPDGVAALSVNRKNLREDATALSSSVKPVAALSCRLCCLRFTPVILLQITRGKQLMFYENRAGNGIAAGQDIEGKWNQLLTISLREIGY